MDNQQIIKMIYFIQDYVKINNLKDTKLKDLKPVLIEKKYFNTDHKKGLPLMNL
jgi:hypothetical protein